jgi:PAS domain S-box-containing protein
VSPSAEPQVISFPAASDAESQVRVLWLGRVDPDFAQLLADLNVRSVAPESISDPRGYAFIIVRVELQVPSSFDGLEREVLAVAPAILVLSEHPEAAAAAMVHAGFDAFDLLHLPCPREIASAQLRQLLQAHRARTQLKHNLKTLRVELETEINARIAKDLRRERHSRILNRLAGCASFADGNIIASAEEIARGADEAFQSDQSTIWIFNEDYSRVRCVGHHLHGQTVPCRAEELTLAEFPNYLGAMQDSRICPVEDTASDTRGAELREGRSNQGPVKAFLAATFFVRGEKIGIVRVDSFRGPRRWEKDEEIFLMSLADLFALSYEVYERKRIEQALRQSEQKYRLILENAMEFGFLLMDQNGSYLECSPGAEQMLGFDEAELRGKFSAEIFVEADRAAGVPESELAHARRHGRSADERWHRRKDGTRFWASGFMYSLTDEHGALHGFAKIIRDSTDRKKEQERAEAENEALEGRVTARTAELLRTTEQLETFCYTIAHDLRAPLRSMQSFSTILMEDFSAALTGDGLSLLRRIQKSAERMDTLIDDLLQYSRIERTDLPREETEMEEIFRLALDDLQAQLREKDVEVFIQHPLPKVSGNRASLIHVVSNLLTNAIKFTRPHTRPELKIYSEQKGEWVRISVQDNGIGIAESHRERIFRIFERLHRVDEFPGTGIGLAIVAKTIERLGGRTGVDSVPGQGSTFWFELRAT